MFAAALTGCSALRSPATGYVGAFSAATKDVTGQATEFYSRVDDVTVQRKIIEVAADPELQPSDTTFRGTLTNKHLKHRVAALGALSAYAQALAALATADLESEVDKAAKDLYGALTALNKTHGESSSEPLKVNAEDLGVVATAVGAIGREVADRRVRKALQVITRESHPVIESVTQLLVKDVASLSDYVVSQLATVEAEMIKDYSRRAPTLALSRRITELEAIRDINALKLNAPQHMAAVAAAAEALTKAHAALRDALAGNKKSYNDLAGLIGQLAAYGNDLRKFHGQLATLE